MVSNTDWQSKIRAQVASVPEALRSSVTQHIDEYIDSHSKADLPALHDERLLASVAKVWAVSEFVAKQCIKNPALMLYLEQFGADQKLPDYQRYNQELATALAALSQQSSMATFLRQYRHQQFTQIAWWDIAGWSHLQQTMAQLSNLADACIEVSIAKISEQLQQTLGYPQNEKGLEQSFVVIAMGKLGAFELNFSSDVDLIFTYPSAGHTSDKQRSITNDAYFTRLGKQLITLLSDKTKDGFVFRVDMRLRPHGESGPLALNYAALEHYYVTHGRSWERYAMIKARPITGTEAEVTELMQFLSPFVYRRYLDYGSFEALRDLKERIVSEVNRKGMENNIKLGWGGIREIEFIGQAFQLIRGGQEPELQVRQVNSVLALLGEKNHLPGFAVTQLTAAYEFLRNTEHRIQQFADQQTHLLPKDDLGQLRLAFAMGFDNWALFSKVLNRYRTQVQNWFEQVFEAPQATQHTDSDQDIGGVWNALRDENNALAVLAKAGYEPASEALAMLNSIVGSAKYRSMTSNAHSRYNQLMPLVLGAVARAKFPNRTLKRILTVLEAIGKRSSYLALLVENPMVLSQLVKLCDASAWISQQLASQPLLLDELLDPRTLYNPPARQQLVNELEQRMAFIQSFDLEKQMDVLRHFKNASVLRVAAADIANAIPLMEVSNLLTDIAEVCLQWVLNIAWDYLVHRHGNPQLLGDIIGEKGFAILAFGKLGGLELGYGSDLDLVFIYGASPHGHTVGEKSIPNEVFYTRLGQRIIHILTAHTPAGNLYEIDMRLRPSGNSGLLVTPLERFQEYQLSHAWTWEHQALVRARAITSNGSIVQSFEQIRRQILTQTRDINKLRIEVREMRERMREELATKNPNLFDLKQGAGGIVDIEFMVQFMVLAHAVQYPDLIVYTDNIRILEALERNNLLSPAIVSQISDNYRQFRAVIHKLTLQGEDAVVESDKFVIQRESIKSLWHALMLE